MAKRNLESLQKQYAKSSHGPGGPGGPGGPRGGGGGPRGGRGMGGKPKNTKTTIVRLLAYLRPHTFSLVLVLVCMLASTVTSLIGSYLLSPVINHLAGVNVEEDASFFTKLADKVISALVGSAPVTALSDALGLTGPFPYLLAAIFIFICIYGCGIIASYTQARLMVHITQSSLEKIRNDLFEKMQRLPVRYFDANPTGETMSRFTNDVDNIDHMLSNTLTSLISGMITLLGTFVFMLTTNVWLTAITVVFIPIFGLGGAALAKRSRKFYKQQQAALGAVNGYIEETVSGQKVIKVFNHEQECEEEFGLLNHDLRGKQYRAMFWGGIMGPIMGNTSQITFAFTLGVGGIMMLLTGFTPGELTVFANYSRQFSFPITNISQQMTTVFSALAGAERVFAVMDQQPEQPDAEGAIDENTEGHDGIKGDVVFENVTFGYVPEKTVLKSISLYAHPGQKIAFVGSTGAGKTTITNLLNRFYDIESGSITIDGIDIKQYSRDYLRRNIAMVLQDTHLFTGTVMENIRYGRLDATDEECMAAAALVGADDFITRLPEGYNTLLSNNGSNLSQGQRQLIAIARAAVADPPAMILDEATSSIDTRTEAIVQRGMDKLMEGRSVFVIAHRLSTIMNSDVIMVMDHGRIIERGDHNRLMEEKGVYYQLYTGAFELE